MAAGGHKLWNADEIENMFSGGRLYAISGNTGRYDFDKGESGYVSVDISGSGGSLSNTYEVEWTKVDVRDTDFKWVKIWLPVSKKLSEFRRIPPLGLENVFDMCGVDPRRVEIHPDERSKIVSGWRKDLSVADPCGRRVGFPINSRRSFYIPVLPGCYVEDEMICLDGEWFVCMQRGSICVQCSITGSPERSSADRWIQDVFLNEKHVYFVDLVDLFGKGVNIATNISVSKCKMIPSSKRHIEEAYKRKKKAKLMAQKQLLKSKATESEYKEFKVRVRERLEMLEMTVRRMGIEHERLGEERDKLVERVEKLEHMLSKFLNEGVEARVDGDIEVKMIGAKVDSFLEGVKYVDDFVELVKTTSFTGTGPIVTWNVKVLQGAATRGGKEWVIERLRKVGNCLVYELECEEQADSITKITSMGVGKGSGHGLLHQFMLWEGGEDGGKGEKGGEGGEGSE